MARIFDITAASETVVLRDGRGEATFTVTNSSGRPLRGRAKVVPVDDADADWFSIQDEAERPFGIDDTHQFTVDIHAASAPIGRYTFRLDAFSVANPDEDYTRGPAVGFEVAEAPEPTPDGFPWWMVVTAAILLVVVVGVITFVLTRGPTMEPVPDVLERSPDEAREMLSDAAFQGGRLLGVRDSAGLRLTVPPGTVFATWPPVGEQAPTGSPVDLMVLLDRNWGEPADAVETFELVQHGEREPTTVEAQTIQVLGVRVRALTDAATQTLVEQGVIDTDRLAALGMIATDEDIEVPDVSRLTLTQARARLEQEQFRVGQVIPLEPVEGLEVPRGRVAFTIPHAGAKLPRETEVSIVQVTPSGRPPIDGPITLDPNIRLQINENLLRQQGILREDVQIRQQLQAQELDENIQRQVR